MSRYAAMFERLDGTGALGAFAMLGDPAGGGSSALLDALVAGGADMIEVGIPFSDPVADGPVIQAAARRALDAGVRVEDCFDLVAGFRERHPATPVGILTYANLVMARGRAQFFRRAVECGVDSMLVADVPVLEARPWVGEMRSVGLDAVLIAAANTPVATLGEIAELASGYTYCVSRAGVTGIHADASFDCAMLERLAQAGAPPPVLGFGVSTPAHVANAMKAGAAGVICGSAIVALAAGGGDVSELVGALKAATRNDFVRR